MWTNVPSGQNRSERLHSPPAPADLAGLSGVASTATQVQRWVDKTHEARVIVIGERMFTTTIRTDSAKAKVDPAHHTLNRG